jgi:hypothetical protein
MSKNYQYFRIPFDLVSNLLPAPHTLWYATWSTRPPVLEPGMTPPLVIGVTDAEPPAGSVVLGVGSKDPPPPPPPLTDTDDYQSSISLWLQATRAADE